MQTARLWRSVLSRGFKGFAPRADPYDTLYKLGHDRELLKKIEKEQTALQALSMRLSRTALGQVGTAAPPRGGVLGKVQAQTKEQFNALPAHVLVDDAVAEQIVANTSTILAVQQRRPQPLTLPESKVLSKDERAGNKRFTFAFVDTSASFDYATRPVLFREKDGTLRTASPQERDRLMQVAFPSPLKKSSLLHKFSDANIPRYLKDNVHAVILDEVCAAQHSHQPDYIRVHRAVYEDLDARGLYVLLQDTPHWDDFFSFLVREKRTQGLLLALVAARRLEDAFALVSLVTKRKVGNITALEDYAAGIKDEALAAALSRARSQLSRSVERPDWQQSAGAATADVEQQGEGGRVRGGPLPGRWQPRGERREGGMRSERPSGREAAAGAGGSRKSDFAPSAAPRGAGRGGAAGGSGQPRAWFDRREGDGRSPR